MGLNFCNYNVEMAASDAFKRVRESLVTIDAHATNALNDLKLRHKLLDSNLGGRMNELLKFCEENPNELKEISRRARELIAVIDNLTKPEHKFETLAEESDSIRQPALSPGGQNIVPSLL
jgi:DNA repair ATPase RecN